MGGVSTTARNPQEDSRLPYLLRLPIEGGLVLKERDTWPRSARMYCHPFEGDWPEGAEIDEEGLADMLARLWLRYPEVPEAWEDADVR